MMHVSEGRLQAYLDGELSSTDRGEITRHLGECSVCSRELGVLQQAATDLSTALRSLDLAAPPPVRRWSELELQAQGVGSIRTASGGSARVLLKAAVLVLAVAGVLSAVVPGSPLFGWPAALWERVSSALGREEPPPLGSVAEPERIEPGYASILPSAGRVRILLDARAAGIPIVVRWVDQERAFIEVAGAPDDHAFNSGEGWLELIGSGTQITVGLPRAVPEASIEVGGRLYFRKLGTDVQISGVPATVSGGGEEIHFAPQR
jgi:hypothetical protein